MVDRCNEFTSEENWRRHFKRRKQWRISFAKGSKFRDQTSGNHDTKRYEATEYVSRRIAVLRIIRHKLRFIFDLVSEVLGLTKVLQLAATYEYFTRYRLPFRSKRAWMPNSIHSLSNGYPLYGRRNATTVNLTREQPLPQRCVHWSKFPTLKLVLTLYVTSLMPSRKSR